MTYHDFADRRVLLGVTRFCDVASNLPFLAAGLLGLAIVAARPAAFAAPAERWPYIVFFVGLAFTCFGSAYYHLAPDNARLVWDRLPITMTLAGLLLGQVGDRVSVRNANRLLLPAVLVGALSVLYWEWTDNLVPYLVAQMYAAIATVFVSLLYPSRYTHGHYIYWAFAFFMLSKVFEALDAAIFKLAARGERAHAEAPRRGGSGIRDLRDAGAKDAQDGTRFALSNRCWILPVAVRGICDSSMNSIARGRL